jgi:hypothetical protein
MMNEQLLRKLIEKNYFKSGTEVDATFKGIGLSGLRLHYVESTFTVVSVLEGQKTNKLYIDLCSTFDGEVVRIESSDILRIDGMTPERFGENYMIAGDGSEVKPQGRRRGRRPKGWKPEEDDFYLNEEAA